MKLPEANIVNVSAFYHVGDLIDRMVSLFGIQSLYPRIVETYQSILGESLDFPLDTKPRGFSRINYDGTPVQFALTLAETSHQFFQFLGEAGRPGISGVDRIRINRNCIDFIVKSMELDTQFGEIAQLIERMAPKSHVDLASDPGGAFWIGAGFAPSNDPQLKIYMNGTWGSLKDRWDKLDSFAAHFGALDYQEKLMAPSNSKLNPLGTAITLKKGTIPSGRIYLSAYGERMTFYEELSKNICGRSFQRILQEFAKMILAEDYHYPTQTAVCSLGLGEGSEMDFKFELCGHCIFKSDLEALSRIKSFLKGASLESSYYLEVIDILSCGQLSKSINELHCYVGVGQKQGSIYSTVYLKPRLYEINNQYQ